MNPTNDMLNAVKTGNAARVRQLLASDPALVNARDDMGDSAILLSLYNRRPEITGILLEGSPRINFFEAAVLGNITRMWDLLKHYPELVTSFSHDGFTALHLAAFFNQPDVVELLLERHADIHAVAKNRTFAPGATPLHCAVAGGNARSVTMLLNAGAKVNERSQGGYTPLHLATGAGNEDIVAILLRHGADVRLRTDDGSTAEMLATKNGNGTLATLLRKH